MSKNPMQAIDPIIKRPDLQKALDVHPETMRRWIKDGKLPPFDVNLSLRLRGWKRSTLVAAGINI